MTNLLATIAFTVVTNTVEEWPTYSVPAPCPDQVEITNGVFGSYFSCAVAHWATVTNFNAKEKTVVTTVKEVAEAVFKLEGREYRQFLSERIILETKQPMKLEWVNK